MNDIAHILSKYKFKEKQTQKAKHSEQSNGFNLYGNLNAVPFTLLPMLYLLNNQLENACGIPDNSANVIPAIADNGIVIKSIILNCF
jgi:hypothetical protein